MNNRRKLVIALGAGALTASFYCFAQHPGKVWRIGYLDLTSRQSMVDAGRYTALTLGLPNWVMSKAGILFLKHATRMAMQIGWTDSPLNWKE